MESTKITERAGRILHEGCYSPVFQGVLRLMHDPYNLQEETKIDESVQIWKRVRWWHWMILCHVLLIAVKSYDKIIGFRMFWRRPAKMFDLGAEMNYAVWWSGLCIFVAAVLFYRCSHLKIYQRTSEKIPFYLVSVVMMCLLIDEMGSLHEWVNRIYGFIGLIPFAIILGGAFLIAIWKFTRNPVTKKTGLFVGMGLLCFLTVGGLEYIEKTWDLERSFVKPTRLVLEESLELVGISFVVFGGLFAVPRENSNLLSLRNLFGAWEEIPEAVKLVTAMFVIHCGIYLVILITDKWSFRGGNPISVFPVVIFFFTAMRCFYLWGKTAKSWTAILVATVLLLASITQLTNYNYLYAGTGGNFIKELVIWDHPAPWILTLVPFLMATYLVIKNGSCKGASAMNAAGFVLVLMLVLIGLSPSKAHYYFFSGSVAYACFMMVQSIKVTARHV